MILFAVHPLATLNAVLNSLAAVLLIVGWTMILRGNIRAHRAAMVAAFAVSAVFLVSYLTYHALEGSRPFLGTGAVRPIYYAILLTHVVLAAVVPVLALRMFFLAWKGRWKAHRRLGRITLPIWLYVSVTGVVIYLMLYHLYPGDPPPADEVARRSPITDRAAALAPVVAFLLLGLVATEAFGCPTCKDGLIASDEASANIARGYFYSILLMLAMPFTLASCFGMVVWREYRRQQRAGVVDHITDSGVRPPSHGGPREVSPAHSPGVATGSHAS